MNQVLLIDLENCPSQINSLMTDLEKYSFVVVCYAQSGAKIPVDWIIPLTAIVNDKRLMLIKMPAVGKNAADFGIAFWAGVLMAQLPEHAHFEIVSNDTDLDYVVSLLKSQHRSAERIGNQKEIPPVLTEIKTTGIEIQDYVHKFCLFLITVINSRPANKVTLLNSIKAKFKYDDITASKFFETLIKNSIITINGNKIIYNQQKLNQFANK